MEQTIWTTERAAGSLLVASLLIALLALIIMLTSGASAAFSALLQGSLAQMAPYAATFRRLNLLYAGDYIVQLMGLGLLSRLLVRAGHDYLAIPAFSAVLVAAIMGVLHGTFHMSVETWAAEEAARTGSVPEIYELLRMWIEDAFKIGYMTHLAAMATFGWAILRAELLDPWLGWTALVWSVLWLVGSLVGVGAPGILFLMPAAIGFALLWR